MNADYPKVTVTALVVTYGNCTIVKVIRDLDEDMQVAYPSQHVTLEQITEAALLLYQDDKYLGRAVRAYQNGQDVYLDGPACQLPSIGDVTVDIVTKVLDWT